MHTFPDLHVGRGHDRRGRQGVPIPRIDRTALLVVLETFAPLERGVFVLHEMFGHPHTEIAGILGRSSSAGLRLAHRAREHIHARRPRYEPAPGVRRQVTEQFPVAAFGGDVDTLLQVPALGVEPAGRQRRQSPAGGRAALPSNAHQVYRIYIVANPDNLSHIE